MSYAFEFTLKGLPKMTNGSRTHWIVKHRHAATWKRAVAIACHGHLPQAPLVSAALTLTRVSSTEPDFDGLVSGFKHIIDGLVECGVLDNDKMSCIGQPIYKWEKTKPKLGHVRVLVETKESK